MFPSRPPGLPRGAPLPPSTAAAGSEFDRGPGALRPLHPQSVLYPAARPPAGLGCDPLRREPAITGLDWSFAPRRGSGERIARQNPFGPPPGFRPASPCPRLDRPVSGLTAVTPGPVRTPPLAGGNPRLRACRFPYAFGDNPLRLATAVNSPARVSRRTGRPRSAPLVLPARAGFLRGASSLSGRPVCSRPVSGSFHPPSGVLFSVPSRY